jgi:hypothetical protein
MAQADPKNTHGSATIQELVDALWRYIENSDATEKPPRVTATDRKKQKHLDDLEDILCTIAKGRKFAEPERQAQAVRNKLVGRIDYRRSSQARWLHYGRFIDKNSDLRLCYLIRLTNDQLKISQRRGSRSRTAAREEAAAIKNISQLDVVERRAFDILKGARRKPRKNPIEKRATQLADATKENLFAPRRAGRPKGKWTRKPDAKARSFEALKPRLTLTDLVSIAAPIIEEFAGKIAAPIVEEFADKTIRPNNAFMALRHIVCAYSERPPRDLTLQHALSRARRKSTNAKSTDRIVKLLDYGAHEPRYGSGKFPAIANNLPCFLSRNSLFVNSGKDGKKTHRSGTSERLPSPLMGTAGEFPCIFPCYLLRGNGGDAALVHHGNLLRGGFR